MRNGTSQTTPRSRTVTKPAGARGFTLVEVLVSLLVLSIGLLGVAGLQLLGTQNNQSAYLRSQATLMANNIFDRMRANREHALNGGYALAMGDDPSDPGSVSTPAQLAQDDLFEWTSALADLLPNGDGSITVNGNVATVTVQWLDERQLKQGGTAPATTTSFSLSTRL